MASEVANDHGAVGHARERTVASIDREPARAAHGGVAVAAVAAEAAAAVAAPEPAHAARAGRRSVARSWTVRRPTAVREAAAAQIHVHAPAGLARLADGEHPAAEDTRLDA